MYTQQKSLMATCWPVYHTQSAVSIKVIFPIPKIRCVYQYYHHSYILHSAWYENFNGLNKLPTSALSHWKKRRINIKSTRKEGEKRFDIVEKEQERKNVFNNIVVVNVDIYFGVALCQRVDTRQTATATRCWHIAVDFCSINLNTKKSSTPSILSEI